MMFDIFKGIESCKEALVLKKLIKGVEDFSNKKFIISISGGKDSKATLIVSLYELLKVVDRNRIEVIHCETKFEKKETYEELNNLQKILKTLGIKYSNLINEKYPNGIFDLIKYRKRFPMSAGRFCTKELKVQVVNKYKRSLVKEGFEVISLVGIRRDESRGRAKYPDSEKGIKGEVLWYPIVDWTEVDVFEFLENTWGIPSLYFKGEERVGCDICFMSNLKGIANMSSDSITKVKELEKDVVPNYTYFYRNQILNPIEKAVAYAKQRTTYTKEPYALRALKFLIDNFGLREIRFAFVHLGYIPTVQELEDYYHSRVLMSYKVQFDIEVILYKKTKVTDRIQLMRLPTLTSTL